MSAPTTNSAIHNQFFDLRKRPSTSSGYVGSTLLAKRQRQCYYYVLASESSQSEDEGTESIHSIQEKETDYAKDTSDTNTKSDHSSDYDMEVEYELATSAESENPLADGSSSGNEDAIIAAGVVAATIAEDNDLDIWGTYEDDDDSSNSILEPFLHSQVCKSCKTRKTLSCFPLCLHCYQVKKTCYPPRPHRKHRKTKSRTEMQFPAVTKDKLSVCLSGLSQDSGLGSSSQELQPLAWDKVVVPENLIQKTSPKCETSASTLTMTSSSTLDSFSKASGSSVATSATSLCSSPPNCAASIAQLTDPTLNSWAEAAKELCIMCNEMPKNGIFVHSTGGHLCCCYKCAVKFWSKSKRCAACNCRAKNVIKAFIV